MKVAVFVSGRGTNLEALLRAKQAGGLRQVEFGLVLSDNPQARALTIAKDFGVETAFVDPAGFKQDREGYDQELLRVLKSQRIEFLVLAGFMRLLSRVLLEAYPLRIINIHPALLPAFPGLHVQRKAIEYGVKISGCTVHFVDAGVDSGPIIGQQTVPVLDDDTPQTLHQRIQVAEHELYPRCVAAIARGEIDVQGRRVLWHRS